MKAKALLNALVGGIDIESSLAIAREDAEKAWTALGDAALALEEGAALAAGIEGGVPPAAVKAREKAAERFGAASARVADLEAALSASNARQAAREAKEAAKAAADTAAKMRTALKRLRDAAGEVDIWRLDGATKLQAVAQAQDAIKNLGPSAEIAQAINNATLYLMPCINHALRKFKGVNQTPFMTEELAMWARRMPPVELADRVPTAAPAPKG